MVRPLLAINFPFLGAPRIVGCDLEMTTPSFRDEPRAINYAVVPVVALVCACLLPLGAICQETAGYSGEITTGIGYQNSNSPLFGRYTGNTSKGVNTFGSFKVESRDAWDSGSTGYFSAEGSGVEADGRQFSPDATTSVSVGEQGSWGAKLNYDSVSSTSMHRR